MKNIISAKVALITLVVGAFALPASAQRAPRSARPAPRNLQAEFDQIDFDACFANPMWVETSTRAALVVHPDGAWALALDGSVTDANYASLAPALRTCLEDTLRQTFGQTISAAPRTPQLYVRTFDFRIHHEDPAVRLAELRARFDAARSDIARCVLDLSEQRLVVRIRLLADGRVEADLPRPDVNRGICITNSLGTFMPGAAVAIRETIEGSARRRVTIAREGEICMWGERHHRLPDDDPRTCAAGLTCCAAGGAAGSDSICMRTSNCPAYP